MKKMSYDDLLALLQRKESSAAQYVHGQLGQERETAMREYYRLPYGTEEDDGWSKIITSDVADSVEWILPALLKTYKEIASLPSIGLTAQGVGSVIERLKHGIREQIVGFRSDSDDDEE